MMTLTMYKKGATYSADCAKCGQTHTVHEWTTDDFNGDRDAMQAGTFRCEECGGLLDPETFTGPIRQYAARYEMRGYLDCTSFLYGTNKRHLARDVRELFGSDYQ